MGGQDSVGGRAISTWRTEHVFNDDVMGADRATDHVSMDKFFLYELVIGHWPH